MTNHLLPHLFQQKDFDKFFVGFDDQIHKMTKLHDDMVKNISNYPPYNIKKTAENTYVIEIAVAGFCKSDIEIEIEDSKLVVRGVTREEEESDSYLHRGIANRAFTRYFALEDQIEVKDAEIFNGLLKVFLERIIPEHKKPKKIAVKSKDEKKLLQE